MTAKIRYYHFVERDVLVGGRRKEMHFCAKQDYLRNKPKKVPSDVIPLVYFCFFK
jgi:hypothetical protein